MKTIDEVFGWLNLLIPTSLSLYSEKKLSEASVFNLKTETLDRILKDVCARAQGAIDPMEYAEVLINCGYIKAKENQSEAASVFFSKALNAFPEKNYKYAIALWLMGMVEWNVKNNSMAYLHWCAAKKFFESQVEMFSRSQNKNRFEEIPWYQDRIADLSLDLVFYPEEIYSWINTFQNSKLSTPTLRFREIMEAKYAEQKYASVYELMSEIQQVNRFSKDYLETPEAVMECGFIAYQIDNLYESVELLQRAFELYKPGSHQQACVKWMLGDVQLRLVSEKIKAINSFQDAAQKFYDLKEKAVRPKQQLYWEWLETKLQILEKAIPIAVSEKIFG